MVNDLIFFNQEYFDEFKHEGNYRSIEITNIELNISDINKLSKLSNSIYIYNCIINYDRTIIDLKFENILISNSGFKGDSSVITFSNFENYVLVKTFKLSGCEFNNNVHILINHVHAKDISIIGCKNVYKLDILRSNIQKLYIIGTKINDLIFHEVISRYLKLHELHCNVDLYDSHIITPLISSDINIISAVDSSANLVHGVFGRSLDFDIMGYKKVLIQSNDGDVITNAVLKLLIPKGAMIHISRLKCRSNKAIPIELYDLDGAPFRLKSDFSIFPYMYNINEDNRYKLNKPYYPDRFDYGYDECSNGIHFFLNKELALKY